MPGRRRQASWDAQWCLTSSQGSSIGNYSTQWMNEFHCSARGVSAQTWLDVPKARRAKLSFPPIRILFPTVQYVRESVLGEQVSMFPQFSTEGFTDARSLRAEGRCSVEGTSGRARSFLEISSTSPGANAGECSCIPRYTTHVLAFAMDFSSLIRSGR